MRGASSHQQPDFAPYYTTATLCLICALIAALISACGTHNWRKERALHTDRFLSGLDNKTAESLAGSPLTLQSCVATAQRHNLAIQSALVQERIAQLDRDIAFSNFLPSIDVSASRRWNQYRPATEVDMFTFPVAERIASESSAAIEQPIFVPYTWFLFSMYSKGVDLSEFITLRTRQHIALEVIRLFYRCCAVKAHSDFLSTSLRQAEALYEEIEKARAYELVSQSALAEASALLEKRRFACEENRRALSSARARLLEVMGLDPLAGMEIAESGRLPVPEKDMEALALEALLNRPEMSVQDIRVAMQDDNIKMALTRFIPQLSAFGALQHTSDSIMLHQTQRLAGLTGAWSVFSGFADINEYRAARERARDRFIKREQASLMILLQVRQAFLRLQSARQLLSLREKELSARQERLREIKALRQQELVQLSEELEAQAQRDRAAAHLTTAEYGLQVAIATLQDVIGRTPMM